MQYSRTLVFLLLGFVVAVQGAVTRLSQQEGELVVQCHFSKEGTSVSAVSMADLYSELGAAVMHQSGRILPAEILQVAADTTADMIVSVAGVDPLPVILETSEREMAYFPKLITAHRTKVARKMYSGIPVQSILVTPFFEKGGSLFVYRKLIVTISYKPQSGMPLEKGSSLDRVKAVVLNPEEVMTPRITRTISVQREAVNQTMGKCMSFSITNGTSNTDERETNIEHTCNGLYALYPSDISYLGSDLPFNQIALYASDRTLAEKIPAADSVPSGVVSISLYFDDSNSDGLFNSNDRILFYGSSMHRWFWDSASSAWDFEFNVYDHKRIYWITVGEGNPIPHKEPLSGGNATRRGWKLRRVAKTQNIKTAYKKYDGNSSRFWKWFTLSPQYRYFNLELEIFNAVPNSIVEARLSNIRVSSAKTYLKLDGEEQQARFRDSTSQWIQGTVNAQTLHCRADFSTDSGFIDIASFDIRYWRELSMQGVVKPFHFFSDTIPELKSYTISNLPQEPVWCFRLDENRNSASFITRQQGGSVAFSDSSGLGYEYIFTPESAIKRVEPHPVVFTSTGRVKRDLFAVRGDYSYVIVSSPELVPYADSFAAIKEREGYAVLLFSTDDIYRQFSGGAATPVAIRNAMIQLRKQCPDITWLLLFGGGHYDYKGMQTTEPNHIFPFLDDDIVKEDFYALLDKGEKLTSDYGGTDLLIGRIPAVTAQDALRYLDKYQQVMGNEEAGGSWRNSFVMCNDDGAQGEKEDPMKHAHSSDSLFAILMKNRADMQISSINLLEYQYVGPAKPDARKALLEEINSGCAFVNYYGHGSYHTISDEKLFLLEDILTLKNKGQYPFFSFFSCAVGFFDMPDLKDVGSELVLAENKGAIATWASSRSSYNGTNKIAAQKMFRAIFADTCEIASVGTGAFAAKEGSINRKYVLFGDPSYRPYTKRIPLDLTIGKNAGVVLPSNENFQIFDTLWVSAKVPTGFDGATATLILQNPTRYGEKTKDGDKLGNLDSVEYSLPGAVVLDIEQTLDEGDIYQCPIRIPRSIKEGSDSIAVKLSFQKGGMVASAIVDTISVHGVNLTNIDTTDRVGPLVKCRVRYREEDTLSAYAESGPNLVVDGFTTVTQMIVDGGKEITTTYASVTLDIDLDDKSGIDHYSQKVGEGVSVAIDGVMPLTQINDLYQPVRGDSCGRIPLVLHRSQFPGKGVYSMKVQATDQLGNRTIEKYNLEVKSMGEEEYQIGTLFAYPCPVSRRGSTRFWFNQFSDQVTNSVLKIYTLDGRLIRSVKGVQSGFEWDLCDQKGNRLSPNVYLYRLFVEVEEQDGSFESWEKCVRKSSIKKITILP